MSANLWATPSSAGWNRDQALWIGPGGALAVMTLVRPWW